MTDVNVHILTLEEISHQNTGFKFVLCGLDLGGRTVLEKAMIDSAAEFIDELLSDTLKIIFQQNQRYKVNCQTSKALTADQRFMLMD